MLGDIFSNLLGTRTTDPAPTPQAAAPAPTALPAPPSTPPASVGGGEQITPADLQRASQLLSSAGVPQSAIGAVQNPAELVQWASSFVRDPEPEPQPAAAHSPELVKALHDLEMRLQASVPPAPVPLPQSSPAAVPGQAPPGQPEWVAHLAQRDLAIQYLSGLMEKYIVDQEMAKLGDVGDKRDALMAKARTLVMAGEDVGTAIHDAALLIGIAPKAQTPPTLQTDPYAQPAQVPQSGQSALARLRSYGSPTVPGSPAGAVPNTIPGVVQDWGARAEAELLKGNTENARRIAEQAQSRITEQLYDMIY